MKLIKLTVIVFVVTLLLPFPVMAGEGHDGAVEPDPSVDASCEEEDVKIKTRNPAYYVSIETVLNRLKDYRDVVLIDIRSKEDFERLRIPGAIHIPLYAIKTKDFLKTRHLVLVDEGYHSSQLEQKCWRLRESGFASVSILNGGLSDWIRSGAPVEGDLSLPKEIPEIHPRDFSLERNYGEWGVFYVSNAPQSDADSLFPGVIAIPDSDDPRRFISAWKRDRGTQSNSSLFSVLILTDRGEGYERIEEWVREGGVNKAFYLEGGLEGYRRFQKEQALIRPSRKTTEKGMKRCGSSQ